MRTVTLGQIRDRARERAGMVYSDFVSNPEWNRYINTAWTELIELLAKVVPGFFETSVDIVTDGSTGYDIPLDHYKTLAVEEVRGTRRLDVPELMFQERNRYSTYCDYSTESQYGYRLVGYQLVLSPPPPAGMTFTLVYIPSPPDLTASSITDATVIDGIAGYEQLLVVMASKQAFFKQKDMDQYYAELKEEERLKENILEMMDDRSPPVHIVSTRDDGPGSGY